ncbi:MAG: asparagine synthase (glutamine-hydrolyzing) [Vicinamibacterales bacterium]
MCGIAGVFGHSDRDTVAAMLAALRHRGPDDEFIVAGDRFTLGARRLSILDVAGGRQPLTSEDGRVVAAQNGELYNFPELRPALLAAGHALHTRTDTELLPHLWEEHGEDLPRHLDGMFALAIWDDRRQVGFLARDRMGKKPLYYWSHRGALYFASELKAILAVPGFERRLNDEALHHYLAYKHVPHPMSIFKGVQALAPAHRLLFTPGRDPDVSRYWSLSFAPRDAAVPDEREAAEELLVRLRSAVRRRLLSDVPVGFFLSGGLDSSLTTVLAAEAAASRVQTFTLTYAGQASTAGKEEDRRWARYVAQRWGTEHYEETIEVTSYPDSLRHVLRAFDEPFAGVVSTYFLAQRMAQHVKVAVAGDGADELFGSYLSHRLAAGAQATPDVSGQPDWEWRAKLLVFSEAERMALYAPAFRAEMSRYSTAEHLRQAFCGLTAADPLNRMLEAEWRGIFPDQVLTFVDRLSMAHSLEVRSAFLDTAVVEFVASLPGSLKIAGGVTKYLLKRAAERYFPAAMIHRPKEGFLMPVTQWVQGPLEAWVRETLAPRRLAMHGLFDPAGVQALVTRIYEPDADYRDVNKVLALLAFQEWYELYRPAR